MPTSARGFPLPAWSRPYTYRKGKRLDFADRKNRIVVRVPAEGLSGFVHGLDASDLEERFAIALNQLQLEFTVRFLVGTLYSLPGEDKEIDFIVDAGFLYPIEIDADFTHRGADQQEKDKLRDAQINEVLSKEGYFPIQRISGARLQTIPDAIRVVSELF